MTRTAWCSLRRWYRGQTAQVQVTVADPDGTAFVSLSIDWNGDGDFGDAGEVVLSDQAYAAGGHTSRCPYRRA